MSDLLKLFPASNTRPIITHTNKQTQLLLEYFADKIDNRIQTEMFSELMARYTDMSKQLEERNRLLTISDANRREAQKIALLGNWEIDIARQSVNWSDTMYPILEMDIAADLAGLLKKVHPDDFAMVRREIKKSLAGRISQNHRYRLIMDDGRVKWVFVRSLIQYNKNGEPAFVHGTLQDITESVNLEEKLKKYNGQLEGIVQEKIKEIFTSHLATIHALVKITESRDDETGAHIERTTCYCKLMAEKLQQAGIYQNIINNAYIENIAMASPLHDIGKVGIKDAILLKPGRLTADEYAAMKTHVSIGYKTLASVEKWYPGNAFLKTGMEISQYHHEKWDGSGYINGMAGEDIPLSARIMALSDVYDALRSKRVYKEAYSHNRSLAIITEGRGKHFDPLLVDIFRAHHFMFRDVFDRLSG